MTSGSISFSSLVGIGSSIQVVDLDELKSLQNSSSSSKWTKSFPRETTMHPLMRYYSRRLV